MRHRKGGRPLSAAAAEKFSNTTTHPSLGQRLHNLRNMRETRPHGDWLIRVILYNWLSLAEVPVTIWDLKTIEHGLVLLRETGHLRGSV